MDILKMIRDEARGMNGRLVDMRRRLHEEPELGMETVKTAAFAAEHLRALGAEDVGEVSGTHGVTGVIRGALPGRTLALRADMDALPIMEDTGLPFASKNSGVMHACGHDAHTAMLLGAAELIGKHRDALRGAVKFIFQPGEEITRGAEALIERGVLDGVDAIAGLHTGSLWSGAEGGDLACGPGGIMASADLFRITVRGQGGHGAMPNITVDPISAACRIYDALQTIVSRETAPTDAAVVTVGVMQAGSAPNVIPGECVMRGTTRALSPQVRKMLETRITEIAKGIAASMRASAEVEFTYGPPPVINDGEMLKKFVRAAGGIVGAEHVKQLGVPTMVSEDMAFYLEKVPGVFFFHPSTFGGGRDYPHHHAKFTVNEDVLWTGTGAMAGLALTWQE